MKENQNQQVLKKYNKLFLYISKTFFKSWTTYVCFFGFGIALTLVAMIPYFVPDLITKEILDLIFYMELAISCVGIGVQSVIKICQIFLDPQRDGIEVLILSKPVKRSDIWIARTLFWLGFINVVALTNITIMILSVSLSPWAKLLMGEDFLFLSFGSYFSQIIISLFLMGLTLSIGYSLGTRAARTIPSGIITCSYIVSSIAPFITNVVSPISPLRKINVDFATYINSNQSNIDKINNIIKSNTQNGMVVDQVVRIEPNLNTFYVKDNRLIFDGIKLLNKDGNVIEVDQTIINALIPDIFNFLYNSQKDKEIHFNWFLVILDYVNPMSGILKIARTNSQYNKRVQSILSGTINGTTLSRYSTYSNIAANPYVNASQKYFYEKLDNMGENEKDKYGTIFKETTYDEPWMIGINWVSISVFLFTSGYLIYIRRDFK